MITKENYTLEYVNTLREKYKTDIDILVKPGTDVDHYINEASKIFPFKTFDEDRRVGKNKIGYHDITATREDVLRDTSV